MKHLFYLFLFSVISAGFFSCSKDDDNSPAPGGSDKKYALVIKSGGQSISEGGTFTFEAQLVGTDGSITPVTSGITYASSASGVLSISGSTVSAAQAGTTTLTATYTYQGTTYTASVPVVVKPATTIFAVNPWTIMWEADGTEFELNPIYLGGTSIPTYTYSSTDASIASVSAAGVVKVLKAGSCVIRVTASLEGNPTVDVPVLVLGEPTVPLPVSQVKITPGSWEMFENETKAFTAKAFKIDGSEVTGKTIKWSIRTTDSTGTGPAASIDQSGNVSAIRVGEATVYAEVEGIVSQATITINPEFAFVLSPIMSSLNPGEAKNFTLTTYQIVDKTKYRNNDPAAFAQVSNPANVKWELPFSQIPIIGSQFQITASGASSCSVKAKDTASPGMMEFLLAYMENDDNYAPGVASLSVGMGGGGNCDCGAENPAVASISVANTNVTLQAFFGSFDLNAQALDAGGSPVAGAEIKYCSSNDQVAAVDFNGSITGLMTGTAQITVCVGSKTKIVNVTVN